MNPHFLQRFRGRAAFSLSRPFSKDTMDHSVSTLSARRPARPLVRRVAALLFVTGNALGALLPAMAAPWSLVDPAAKLPQVAEGRSAVVIVQPAAAPTASIFIDGHYQATLVQASWTSAEVCPGSHYLHAAPDAAALAVKESSATGERHDLPTGSTTYLQLLADAQGTPLLETVAADTGKAWLERLPRAAHTLSRVPKTECMPVAPAPPAAVDVPPAPMPGPAATHFRMQAALLFATGKATLDPLAGQGRQALDKVIEQARARYRNIESVHVDGYADPTGTAAGNLTLSHERARTVARYLMQAGFGPGAVTAQGRGATALVAGDCARRFRRIEQINTCNEPNRRVEIRVNGISRN